MRAAAGERHGRNHRLGATVIRFGPTQPRQGLWQTASSLIGPVTLSGPVLASEVARPLHALRAGALVGGTLLTLYGLRRLNLAGVALIGLGLGLALTGASNAPADRLVRLARGRRGVGSY